MSSLKFNLTVEDKILLYLLAWHRSKDDYELPSSVTQPGIAHAIDIRRSHVSYVVKGLKTKGFVEERIAHVKKLPRKRKVYFLSEDGYGFASKLKENILATSVKFDDGSGKLKDLKLSDLNEKYAKKVPFVKFLTLISPDGIIEQELFENLESLNQFKIVTPRKVYEPVTFLDNIFQPAQFVGRAAELNQLITWLEADHPRVIVITGIPGIGKTTLVAKILFEYADQRNKNLFFLRLHSWSSVHGILLELSEFLFEIGKKSLKFQLEHEKNLELDLVKKLLETELMGINAFFIFDDLQKANEDIKMLISMLTELLVHSKFSGMKIIVLSRRNPEFYDRRDVALEGMIAELALTGLSSQESRQLLNLDELREVEFKKIYQLTAGHPLTLQLINNHILKQKGNRVSHGSIVHEQIKHEFHLAELFKEDHDINKYIREEIFDGLSILEKKLLNLISVYRYPIQSDGLFAEDDIDHECIDSLINRAMLYETTGGFESHELIKEFFYRRLTPTQRKTYHKKAAEYYLTEFDTELALGTAGVDDFDQSNNYLLEAQYHYIQAKDHQKAAELAVDHGEKLISKGYSEELFILLQDLDMNSIPEDLWSQIMIHKGRILIFNGNWDMALQCFNNSLEICQSLNDDDGIAKAYNAIGAVHYRKGDCKTARDYYEKGLELATTVKDDIYCSKLFSNIALVDWSEGALDQAIELIKKSLEISEKLNDKSGIARAYNNLGIIYWEQLKLDSAIKAYEKSLALSQELKDRHTIAILYDNLGEAYRLKGNSDKAEELYNKSLELSEELGFKWQIAEVNQNLGIMFKDNKPETSIKHLKTALELYTLLGAKREVEKVKEILDQIETASQGSGVKSE